MKNHISTRMIALLLAVITLFSLFTLSASAASSLDDAMAEVDIYAKNEDLNWLTMNGSVKTQHYTYYNYTSVQNGQTTEIPAYCVDPKLYGVPALVSEGTSIKYSASSTVSDPKVCGILGNGYPHESLSVLKVNTKEEAYYATKTALWIYLLGNWSVNGLGINPNLSGADKEAAERVLAATKSIYYRGMEWSSLASPKLTATPDKEKAYPATINGQQCYQQVFTVESDTWSIEKVKVRLAAGAPTGAVILDMDDRETDGITLSTGKPYQGKFKVVYPASSIEGESGTVQVNLNSVVIQYAIYYATCLETDQYGEVQDYMLDTDPYLPIAVSAVSRYSVDPDNPDDPPEEPDEPGDGGLRIKKLETGTENPLEGAVFEVKGPNGDVIGSYSTNPNGMISLSGLAIGNYTVTELTPPKNHLLPEHTTQTVTVAEGQTAELTYWNDPYGSLRVEKVSNTGEKLEGVTIQIKNIVTGATQTGQTGPGGVIEFTELAPGGYEVRELAGITGWIADTDTVQTVSIVTGETSTVMFTNKEAPGLRVIKYDRSSHQHMEGVTFAVYRDGVFLSNFTTGPMGEFLIPNAQPGTYRVFEVDTGDDGHILDTTPQEVELKAGDGIKELVFFNDMKPGIHLVKVDSSNLSKPIANARFRIEAVDRSYGPEEFTTDQNGEIDLSKLPANKAYVVTELECPGYIVDDAQRIIQLKENETAHFVFTNSKKPDLLLKKLSSDGAPLAGVSFRLAKIEDASHYLDRTTDVNGEILWEGLEPGVYSLAETATVNDHIIDLREHHVELFPGKTSTIVLENDKRPNLTIIKRDADTGEVVPGTVFEVRFADGHSVQDVTTGPDGRGYLENLLPGVYEISEKSVPEPYLQDAASQLVTLYPNRNREVLFENHKRPSIEIIKENSITHERQANVKFQVWYASNNTSTGEYNDLGVYYTDENGRIVLTGPDIYLRDGWFRVKELEPPHGFALADPDTQEAFIPSGTSHTFLFQNRPLSAICVWKYDSVSPNMAIEGAVFQIRYLSGNTSGTGGTVIGTYRTGKNGSFTVTGLKAGTYIIEELSSDGDHVIDTPPQTVYLSGNDQEVIQVYFGNSPKGSLLVKKIDSVTRQPLSDVEFLVTDSKGNVIGDANGKFVTDSTGSFTVSGIDPGTTLIVKEVRSKSGYILDDVPQTAAISAGQTVTLEFRNQPMGSLLIRKVCAVNPSVTLANAEFKVAYSDGSLVGDSNGVYRSDENGEVRIEGLIPGKSVVVTETKAPDGFIIDSQSQTIVIQAGKVVSLTFKNQPKGAIIIQKRDSATGEPLPGAEFRVTTAAGCEVGLDGVIGTSTLTQNGIFVTDAQGEIKISNLAPGAYVISEIKAPADGYVIDTPSTNVVIGAGGDTQTIVIKNSKAGTLVIDKRDSLTGKPLEGVTFKVTTSTGEFVPNENGQISSNGLYFTDKDGKIIINGVVGTLVVTETATLPGYTIDEATRTQTVVVNPNDTQTLYFTNTPSTTLVIEKYIEGTTTPLKGVTFLVTDSSGAAVGRSNGEFITDENGRIVLDDLTPGTTVTAREVKTLEGYVLDTTPKSILIKAGEVQTLRFYNHPQGTIVVKKLDKQTGEPLAGVEFQITYSDGSYLDDDYGHLSSKGLYKTDANGEIRIPGVVGTLVITETRALPGYVMDEGTKTQTVQVNPGDTQTITVYNTKIGGLTIIKKDEETGERIKGVQFEVRKLNGEIVGVYTTDENGVIYLPEAEKGWYQVVELKAAKGYKLDDTPHQIEVKDGGTATLEITNRQAGSALIHKIDSVTGNGIYGVKFLLSDAKGNPIGTYESDNEGYVYIDKELDDGRYTLREIECAEGYILDTQPKTIYVEYGGCTTVTWKNTAITGQIQIVKTSEDYNPMNGWPAGAPIPGTVFEIYHYRTGNLVDTIRTDKNGVAVSKPLPLGRYKLVESQAADFYGLDKTPIDVEIEHAGQIVKAAMTNKSLSTNVAIEKTGYVEVMPGQNIRYTFSGISNNSTTALTSFYWRDTLPVEAVRLAKITTGTYNAAGSYKIVYKTNLSGSEYRVLADSLNTQQNYVLDASPVALRLASNEYVTEVMFVFGVVPANFRQVEAPLIDCTVVSWVKGGSQFLNQADVGGIYNGQWIMATTRWVTKVYAPSTPLPRTGY